MAGPCSGLHEVVSNLLLPEMVRCGFGRQNGVPMQTSLELPSLFIVRFYCKPFLFRKLLLPSKASNYIPFAGSVKWQTFFCGIRHIWTVQDLLFGERMILFENMFPAIGLIIHLLK